MSYEFLAIPGFVLVVGGVVLYCRGKKLGREIDGYHRDINGLDVEQSPCSDPNERFDQLFKLRCFWWERFDRRGGMNWKVAISTWTAIAAFTGAILSGKQTLQMGPLLQVAILVALPAIVILHMYWIQGVGHASRYDKLKSDFYDLQLSNLVGLSFPKSVTDQDREFNKKAATIRSWFNSYFIAVTFVLCLLAGIVVSTANGGGDSSEGQMKQHPESHQVRNALPVDRPENDTDLVR